MSLDLRDCSFTGPAMPEPFVKYRLEELLNKKKLLTKATGEFGKKLEESWQTYRNKLRSLGEQGGEQRVLNHVVEPLVSRLGWQRVEKADSVATREGQEEGGYLLRTDQTEGEAEPLHLRVWAYPVGADLDAPNKRGRAYRFSPGLVAQRVLLTKGERVGLLTDGVELRILLSDPSGRDSHIGIRLDRSGGWRAAREVPDSFRLLQALCRPSATGFIADLLNEARLSQSSVTKKLREQARRAVEMFVQGLLDDPRNAELHSRWSTDDAAKEIWREGLVLVYRLLFILKLETSPDPARAFSFASSSLWRNSYSPSTALAPVVEMVRDNGAETGEFLSKSLRALFRLFSQGLTSNELRVSPLGGMLFGKEAMPILDSLHWSEQAVAHLLDALLWTPADKKNSSGDDGRERVHYGALDVEDLGRVYEALLELEPGIAHEAMCRLRRAKLEVVVPIAQGAPYQAEVLVEDAPESEKDDVDDDAEDDKGTKGKTKVVFVEEIPNGRFYLRVGLGRKASGSYYTPHPFVRFLVQDTLGSQVIERSPQDDPNPSEILGLKVLDPAMGSGHFLVEACRFLGDALYEACRLCDERALETRKRAESAKTDSERDTLLERAKDLWDRVEHLPDPNNELSAYLPSRVIEGDEPGLSQQKALALCRRLVAVHCLYGVDKNPLAVELARVSLWLESYAEGLPLTFLEHRLICGDSLTGPFFENLLRYPGSNERVNSLFVQGITERLTKTLAEALVYVRDLEATIGKDPSDIELKRLAKAKLDQALQPLRDLSSAWVGGVMLSGEGCDDGGYEQLLRSVADQDDSQALAAIRPAVSRMVDAGHGSVSFDLVFPEVFYSGGLTERTGGFDAVLGNPPWDVPSSGAVELLSMVMPAVVRNAGPMGGRAVDDAALDATELLSSATRAREQFSRVVARSSQGGETLEELSAAFFARAVDCAKHSVGLVLPSSFRRNEGQAWLRSRLVGGSGRVGLARVVGFTNRKRLFTDIPAVMQFDLVTAQKDVATARVSYGHEEPTALTEVRDDQPYPHSLISNLNPGQYVIAEVRSSRDIQILDRMVSHAIERVGAYCQSNQISLTQEVNNRSFAGAVQSLRAFGDSREPEVLRDVLAAGLLPLVESKSFHIFDLNWKGSVGSGWNPVPTTALPLHSTAPSVLAKLRQVIPRTRFFRLALRQTCGSPYTNERSIVPVLITPGLIATHSAIIESTPGARPTARALGLSAILSTFPCDYIARQQIGANLSLFILDGLPLPAVPERFFAHAALRLSANHVGYAALWREQLGDHWREAQPRCTWPVLEDSDARWLLRAALDAIVAHAFGLGRDQYSTVLHSFTNRFYLNAPSACLAAFDEIANVGLDDYTKKHDPYWDVPVVTSLPLPADDLPGALSFATEAFRLEPAAGKPRRARSK